MAKCIVSTIDYPEMCMCNPTIGMVCIVTHMHVDIFSDSEFLTVFKHEPGNIINIS